MMAFLFISLFLHFYIFTFFLLLSPLTCVKYCTEKNPGLRNMSDINHSKGKYLLKVS